MKPQAETTGQLPSLTPERREAITGFVEWVQSKPEYFASFGDVPYQVQLTFVSMIQELLTALTASEERAAGLKQELEAVEERAAMWCAEAKAHAARFAVLEKADGAPFCDGQCGICDCQVPAATPGERKEVQGG